MRMDIQEQIFFMNDFKCQHNFNDFKNESELKIQLLAVFRDGLLNPWCY